MYTYHIDNDDFADCPRDWDNLGTIVAWHRRYNLSDDRQPDLDPYDWLKEAEKLGGVILPIYMYEHGGISISTKNSYPYNDRWDGGQVGYIHATPDKIRAWYGVRRITNSIKKLAIECMQGEIEAFDRYLRGDVYMLTIYDELGEVVESGGGFDSYDDAKQEAERYIKHLEGVPACA